VIDLLALCFDEFDVSEYPQLEYSKKDVVRAGEALRGNLVWGPDTKAEIEKVFSVANSWRASHALPMARMRAELHGRMSALRLKGLTAARLKQMPSIRGKLRRIDSNLRQLQDLGGCRAVVPTIDEARQLATAIRSNSPHTLKREDSYMDSPRESGYRSHHLVFAFEPRDCSESGYEGRLIELQIRSRLQHSWATAVEAVGLYRGESLKSGMGSEGWLRLFELMSLEIAASEGFLYARDERNSRVQEIVDLDASLGASQTLDNLSVAVHSLEHIARDPNHKPRYCLIKYDHTLKKVSVSYLGSPSKIGGALEHGDENGSNIALYSSVVVEMDKIENLKTAYPNYFGDVQLFKSNLAEVVAGMPVKQYSLPPIERVAPRQKEVADDSWLRAPSQRNRRWEP
jgi:Region found in RelA / SpoT proteins